MIPILTIAQLNKGQRSIVVNARKWYNGRHANTYPFVIRGAAGTGKTSIVPTILTDLNIDDSRCVVVAIAGTAVNNLQQKFEKDGRTIKASTIAKFLYAPVTIYKLISTVDPSKNESLSDPDMLLDYFRYKTSLTKDQIQVLRTALKIDKMRQKSGFPTFKKELVTIKPYLYDNDNIILKLDVKFSHKSKNEANEQLIIIDEAGMVPQKDIDRLIQLKIPIIMCADKYQIGPVNPDNKPEYRQNDYVNDDSYRYGYELTELMRQQAANPVLELASAIKDGYNVMPYYKDISNPSGTIKIMTKDAAIAMNQKGQNFWDALLTYAAIQAPSGDWIALCHRNDYVSGFNIKAHEKYQEINKLSHEVVQENEPLIITMNNKSSMDLTNGTTCKLVEIHKRSKFFVIADVLVNDKIFYNVAVNTYEMYNPRINQNFNKPTSKIPALAQFYANNDNQFSQYEVEQYKKDIISLTNEDRTSDPDLDQADYLLFVTYGYAMTIHKAQGKEWHTVALLSTTPAYYWSSANYQNKELYYTAVTRTMFILNIVDAPLTQLFF